MPQKCANYRFKITIILVLMKSNKKVNTCNLSGEFHSPQQVMITAYHISKTLLYTIDNNSLQCLTRRAEIPVVTNWVSHLKMILSLCHHHPQTQISYGPCGENIFVF